MKVSHHLCFHGTQQLGTCLHEDTLIKVPQGVWTLLNYSADEEFVIHVQQLPLAKIKYSPNTENAL